MDALLAVSHLSKRFGALQAVLDVSFTVGRGEVFGLLGPNGAGKTTLIKLLCGLLSADAGQTTLNDLPVSLKDGRVKGLIGLCPQNIVVWKLLSGREQLEFMGASYGLSCLEARRSAAGLLARLGLEEVQHQRASRLSGGMQRRLNIALALVHRPALVVLDEPQAGLDPQSRVLVREFIRDELRDRAVILTTHDMEEADRLSTRMAIMDHGQLLTTGTPQEVRNSSGADELLIVRVTGLDAPAAGALLPSLPSALRSGRWLDGSLHFQGQQLQRLLPHLNDALQARGLSAEDITLRRPTLEDTFIHLTGRRLRA